MNPQLLAKEATVTHLPRKVSEDMIDLPVSASDKINLQRERFAERIDLYGIQSLKQKEWALYKLLNKAHDALKDGTCRIDAAQIRREMIANLRDEGVEAWRVAFFEALEDAKANYFLPHPDSQSSRP